MLDINDFESLRFQEEDYGDAPPVDLDDASISDTMPEKWERLLRHNPLARKVWEASHYSSPSHHAYALMWFAGCLGLDGAEAAALHVVFYARLERKEDGFRKAKYALRAWVKGREHAEAWEQAAGNGRPLDHEPGEPGPSERRDWVGEETTFEGETDEGETDIDGGAESTTGPEGGENATGRFTLPLSQLLSVADEPIPYLADRLIVAEANGFIGGEPKSLKSWLALYIALCLSSGTPIFGKYAVTEAVRVLYLQEEDSERRVRHRIRKILTGLGVDPPTDEFFRYSIRSGLLLDDEEWLKRLHTELAEYRPGIVIGDVFELMHEKDSDRRSEMKLVFHALNRLRDEFGSGFLLADHFKKSTFGGSNRGGQRLAGTVGKHAWGENSLYLFPARGTNRVRVETELKDGPSEVFCLSLDDTPEGGVVFQWEAKAGDRTEEMKEKVMAALANVDSPDGWATAARVGEAMGIAKNTARKYLDLLVDEDKKLEREMRQREKVKAWCYRLIT